LLEGELVIGNEAEPHGISQVFFLSAIAQVSMHPAQDARNKQAQESILRLEQPTFGKSMHGGSFNMPSAASALRIRVLVVARFWHDGRNHGGLSHGEEVYRPTYG
jgi:hypothetical protein